MQDTRKGLNLWSIFPLIEEESPGDFSLACEDLNDALVLADVLRRAINKEIWNLQWEMASTPKHMKDLGVQLIVHGADIVFYKKSVRRIVRSVSRLGMNRVCLIGDHSHELAKSKPR